MPPPNRLRLAHARNQRDQNQEMEHAVRTRGTKIHKRRAKQTLIALGVISCAGGAAVAVAQTVGTSQSPANPLSSRVSKPRPKLSIRVVPLTRSVAPGDTTAVSVWIRNRSRSGRVVKLSILDGLPQGATASFRWTRTRKSRVALTVDTGSAQTGGHHIRLKARSGHHRAIAALDLVIGSRKHPNPPQHANDANFTIAGGMQSALAPGFAAPLNLELTNPGTTGIAISGLGVSVHSISAPRASTSYPCTSDDFSVAQFSGAYGFTIPASSSRSLSELGFQETQLPRVAMPDRSVNQNGCKGASLQFEFTGTATGGK
jgi:hypothetical protein